MASMATWEVRFRNGYQEVDRTTGIIIDPEEDLKVLALTQSGVKIDENYRRGSERIMVVRATNSCAVILLWSAIMLLNPRRL